MNIKILKKTVLKIFIIIIASAISQNILFSDNLQELIEKGNLKKITQLVVRQPEILETKIWGNPPLFYTAIMGKVRIGKFFIKKGLKADRVTPSGDTPLGFAIEAENNALSFIKMLLKNGADLNYKTALGESYLHVAAFHSKKKLVDFFLNEGIDINVVKNGNLTPLHIAAVVGNKEIVKFLIQKNADLNIKSSDGGTPLHFARAAENIEIVNILKANNARDIKREFPIYQGGFLGLKKPGSTPMPFAPEIFQDIYRPHSAPAFSPDGTEVYWEAMFMWGRMAIHRIWYMKQKNGKWMAPRIAPFSKYSSFTPAFSSDGKKLFYSSKRPIVDGAVQNASVDLWYVERKSADTEWSSPKHLKIPVSKDIPRKTFPYSASDNTIYFNTFGASGIYKSSYINGTYSKPESLGNIFNTDYIDSCKARKYLFITSNKRNGNLFELYISYHKNDGKWSKPLHMGNRLHQGTRATNGRILPGGKYLIFCRYMSYYWMDSSIIEELKPDELK